MPLAVGGFQVYLEKSVAKVIDHYYLHGKHCSQRSANQCSKNISPKRYASEVVFSHNLDGKTVLSNTGVFFSTVYCPTQESIVLYTSVLF